MWPGDSGPEEKEGRDWGSKATVGPGQAPTAGSPTRQVPSISCTGRPAAGRHHPSCAIGRCPPQGQGDPGQTLRASLREREPLCRQPQGTPSHPRGSAPSLTGEGTEAQRAP